MGASPVSSSTDEEVEKLRWAEKWGADTVMDLSTGGDLNATRRAIVQNANVPIGVVPIYSMIIGRKIEDLDWSMIEAELVNQCEQGVDYMTMHAGIRQSHLPFVKNRLIGIVSRGGSLLAKWMITHNKENIMYAEWDRHLPDPAKIRRHFQYRRWAAAGRARGCDGSGAAGGTGNARRAHRTRLAPRRAGHD